MKQSKSYKLYLTFVIFILIHNSSKSQIFNWYQDGFYFNQTSYSNIDGSGINLEMTGMETGLAESNGQYQDWLKVGIDDNGVNGVQHIYKIKFSETVNVEFHIENINRDTSGMCYNDRLIIPGAIVLGSYSVNIANDTIYAPWDSLAPAGWLHLKYVGVDSLTIIHGEGVGCNPGHLFFSPLVINDNVIGLQSLESEKSNRLIRIVDVMGKETQEHSNELLFYIYEDGTIRKVFKFE